MRQLRRGAPFGWLLALLFPLLVSGGLGGSTAAALLRHPAVVSAGAEHQPLSRQAPAGRPHDLAPAHGGLSAGAAGGHPAAVPPPDARHLSPPAGLGSRPAGDDDPRPPSALLVRPARAPPSTGG
jgi:hypothetical protein